MFITSTQAGGLGRYHSGSIFSCIYIYGLYIYGYLIFSYVFIKRQIRFIARLCKKIYRIYFRMLNYCNCNHCPVQIINLSASVHNYSAIYLSHKKSFDSSSPYVKFDYTWIIVRDFLRPCVNIAINFLQNLNLSLFTTDIFPEKISYRISYNEKFI